MIVSPMYFTKLATLVPLVYWPEQFFCVRALLGILPFIISYHMIKFNCLRLSGRPSQEGEGWPTTRNAFMQALRVPTTQHE
jgi:hypothetical protein